MKIKLLAILFILIITATLADPVLKISSDKQNIKISVEFDNYKITKFNKEYHCVSISKLLNLNSPGKPSLPFYTLRFLLPPDKELQDVAIIGKNKIIKGNYKINPASVMIPWFIDTKNAKLAVEDQVYSKAQLFPGKLSSKWIISKLAGYKIFSCNLYPVQFDPNYQKLHYYKKLDITLQLNADRSLSKVKPGYKKQISSLVCNPDFLNKYSKEHYCNFSKNNFPYVIITSESLLALKVDYNFEYFANFLSSNGVITNIVTVEEIYKNYPGKDKAEKVRNFIKYAFENWNTRYVLLGGDGDKNNEIVPVRRFPINLHYVYYGWFINKCK